MTTIPPLESPSCPSCEDGTGRATSVSITGGRRTIVYRCDCCERVWMSTDADPDTRRTPYVLSAPIRSSDKTWIRPPQSVAVSRTAPFDFRMASMLS